LWVSLTWLAGHTQRLEFGPLVSPVSFRHPTLTARMAAAVDDLSGGRLTLGLGAGWQEREHTNYGWELLDVGPRFARFEEGLEVVHAAAEQRHAGGVRRRLLPPARCHPAAAPDTPRRPAHPHRRQRAAADAAAGRALRHEWNGVFLSPADYADRNRQLDDLLRAAGRAPESVRRSLMAGCVFGRDEAEVAAQAAVAAQRPTRTRRGKSGRGGWRGRFADQLAAWAAAGVQRIMLQWLDLDDLDGLAALAGLYYRAKSSRKSAQRAPRRKAYFFLAPFACLAFFA
jgi:alkanesulfonate monooxygenase SsuD/methylene tetrahydromethanopterin reductase-like flavin-dependent oxidoreductase (luciferase family)